MRHFRKLFAALMLTSILPLPALALKWLPSIPTYPQHGPVVSAYCLSMGNVAGAQLDPALAAYDNPAALAFLPKSSLAINVASQWEDQSIAFQPGSLGLALPLSPAIGLGFTYFGNTVDQSSPRLRYVDHRQTGPDSANFELDHIHSKGGRSWVLAGIGLAIGPTLSAGVSTGYVFGELHKDAHLRQYQSDAFATMIGDYRQSDVRQYAVVPVLVGTQWEFVKNTHLAIRFYTPASDTAHEQKTVRDASGIVMQTPLELDGNHIFAHDAEVSGSIRSQWAAGQLSVVSVEMHDNVFFGGSAWENTELRFGHEVDLGQVALRLGGHFALPMWDGGTLQLIDQSVNLDANSWGLSAGLGIKLAADGSLDVGISRRDVNFTEANYQLLQFAVEYRAAW